MNNIINIFGDISSTPDAGGVSAEMVFHQVKKLNGEKLEININSYGGEVFEAVAIDSILSNYSGEKKYNIMGVCASAATLLVMGTDAPVHYLFNSMLMVHQPAVSLFSAKSQDLRSSADMLDKIERNHIIGPIARRTGLLPEDIQKKIDGKDWWLSGEELSLFGFILSKDSSKVEASAKDIMTKLVDIRDAAEKYRLRKQRTTRVLEFLTKKI